ncbi:sensor histidine kinase [Streptomyces sp. NPDC057011]|uniref:sensor histidine kinase n=1 Tax=unclassified Streptomyces TaxID=2593676 RepID=UPI00364287D0
MALFTAAYGVLNAYAGQRHGLLDDPDPLPSVLLSLLVGAVLLVRRRFPLWVVAVVYATDLVRADPVAMGVVGFTLGSLPGGRYRSLRPLALGVGVLVHTFSQVSGLQQVGVARALVYSAGIVGGGALAGLYLGAREALLTRAVREAALQREGARAEERRRIAWEMHDVVSHRVVQIVMDADVLALGLRPRDPERAAEAGEVAALGRQVLEELRETLGVLRRGDTPVTPLPTLADLAELVERARETAGTPVRLRQGPGLGQVPAGVQRTAYRVVQEALTNALKHAPGAPVEVELALASDGGAAGAGGVLRVHVGNGPAAGGARVGVPSGGNGLAGMDERVRVAGGRLVAGPRPDGAGFDVRADLPLTGAR